MDVSKKANVIRHFIFGNGKTRLNIDFDEVKPYGTIYACNAVYRVYKPDYLIAVDKKMLEELHNTGYMQDHNVYTYITQKTLKYQNLNYIDPALGYSSGPTALYLSKTHCPDEVYIFGFDFEGIDGKINNVFAGTINYRPADHAATFYGNWLKQTENIIKENTHIKYFRVTIPNFFETKWTYDNYYQILYEDFRKMISTWDKIR
ncbi:MAG: hypothetical protein EBS49_03395 [Verrucomicrobia bacterium]|nr:hypothetical protein [Verrucomicrobiota bacterium]